MRAGRFVVAATLAVCWLMRPVAAEHAARPVPDITWQPRPPELNRPVDARYIDFEHGSDDSPGTRERPWQHHPWDAEATGLAARCEGPRTYCFKRGVVYRGALVAEESGSAQAPIVLTVDPEWGSGKAGVWGSARIEVPWRSCTEGECPEIPAAGRSRTWYSDLEGEFVPRMLWEVRGERATRIPMARTPNWNITDPDDPRSQWWELTGYVLEVRIGLDSVAGFRVGDYITGTGRWDDRDENRDNITQGANRVVEVGEDYILLDSWQWKKGEIQRGGTITNGQVTARVTALSGTHDLISRLVDEEHLTEADPSYYVGATMWAEKESMPKPDAETVIGYDPQEHSLRINYHRGSGAQRQYDRYYLENLPQFLDRPGEYYYAERGEHAGRLFLRLPDDRDPNEAVIEAARAMVLLDIQSQNHIRVQGLDLRFSNALAPGSAEARHAALHACLVRLAGSCSGIGVYNCELSHAAAGITAFPAGEHDFLDKIVIADNDMHDIDSTAVGLSNGRGHYLAKDYGARLIHVRLLRNRVRNVGYRSLPHWGLGMHALQVEGGELVEVAGNVVDNTWGAGILCFNGSDYAQGQVERPLMRTLIHHNKVTNSLLGLQDYGGIASWMGGPSYVYCNISGNPVGYKHAHWRRLERRDWYRTSCYGVGIYIDGQYKGYVFNNVVWGKNNEVNDRIYSSAAFNEAMGFMNVVFSNTLYRFGVGLHKGMLQHNRCYYLGNLLLDMGHKFIQQEPVQSAIEHDSLAYAANVFQGTPANFGQLGEEVFPTLDEWRAAMAERRATATETGSLAPEPQVADMAAHDFRLRADATAIDGGVRVFVPWALYAVVGEWGFYEHPADPSLMVGENMNWNDEWVNRSMYQDIPRNHLRGHGVDASDFTRGILEDWVDGALELNGKDQYCMLADDELRRGYEWRAAGGGSRGSYPGEKRVTVDMDTNDFLVEVVLRTVAGLRGAGVAGKRAERGYSLEVDEAGRARMRLDFGGAECARSSTVAINDGEWHHVVAEVFRGEAEGINIYVDGQPANGAWTGAMEGETSLSNDGDFVVGRMSEGDGGHFAGALDFLRVARGTLADAETTIEELYQWEFDGPFLRDFHGRPPTGTRRDAGALEHLPT